MGYVMSLLHISQGTFRLSLDFLALPDERLDERLE